MPADAANDDALAVFLLLAALLLSAAAFAVRVCRSEIYVRERLRELTTTGAMMHEPIEPDGEQHFSESPFLDHVVWLRWRDDLATWKRDARFSTRFEAQDYIDDFRRCHAGVDGVALPDAVRPVTQTEPAKKRKKKKRREGGDDASPA